MQAISGQLSLMIWIMPRCTQRKVMLSGFSCAAVAHRTCENAHVAFADDDAVW